MSVGGLKDRYLARSAGLQQLQLRAIMCITNGEDTPLSASATHLGLVGTATVEDNVALVYYHQRETRIGPYCMLQLLQQATMHHAATSKALGFIRCCMENHIVHNACI